MILSGRVSDAGLMARLRSGEELELAGAFSEGIYFTGPGGMVMLHDTQYGCLPFGIAIPGFSGLSRAVGANCGQRASLRPEGIFSPGTGLCIYTDFEPVPSPAAVRPSLENLELRDDVLDGPVAVIGYGVEYDAVCHSAFLPLMFDFRKSVALLIL